MNGKTTIACLPVAGNENPYQSLMIKGLNQSQKINAFNGNNNRFIGILKTVFKYHPDYIHFDWISSYYERRKLWMTLLLLPVFYFQILYIRYFTKTKLVWTLHNIMPHNAKHIWLHKKVRHFFSFHVEWIRVFSESSIDRATVQLRVSKNKFKVIPEGDYVSVYPNKITKTEARKELNIDQSKKVLLSLGYIKPYKGLEQLIKTFSEIDKSNIELVIAGQSMDAIYLTVLRDLIKNAKVNTIQLIDTFIPSNKLQVYYNAADVVVLPFTNIENSGSAIMAMGFKKAIIAPKIGVLEKRLEGQDFLLYDNLLSGLNSIFAIDEKALEKIGVQNFLALQQYKWENFAIAFK